MELAETSPILTPALIEHIEHRRRGGFVHVDLDLGQLRAQMLQGPRQDQAQHRIEAGNAQRLPAAGAELGQPPFKIAQLPEDRLGLAQQVLSRFGELQFIGAPLEQAHVEGFFEPLDQLRQRGLGQAQILGRACQAVGARNRKKDPQLLEGHARAMLGFRHWCALFPGLVAARGLC